MQLEAVCYGLARGLATFKTQNDSSACSRLLRQLDQLDRIYHGITGITTSRLFSTGSVRDHRHSLLKQIAGTQRNFGTMRHLDRSSILTKVGSLVSRITRAGHRELNSFCASDANEACRRYERFSDITISRLSIRHTGSTFMIFSYFRRISTPAPDAPDASRRFRISGYFSFASYGQHVLSPPTGSSFAWAGRADTGRAGAVERMIALPAAFLHQIIEVYDT
jgi:hypothetical protein